MKKKKTNIFKWILLSLLSIAMFIDLSEIAFVERGYFTIGGEVGVLFLPLIYKFVSDAYKDFIEICSQLQTESEEELDDAN